MILFIGLPIISTGVQSFYAQHDQVVKEVKLSPKISDNDFNIRVKMGQKFLSKGYAIKLTVWFKEERPLVKT